MKIDDSTSESVYDSLRRFMECVSLPRHFLDAQRSVSDTFCESSIFGTLTDPVQGRMHAATRAGSLRSGASPTAGALQGPAVASADLLPCESGLIFLRPENWQHPHCGRARACAQSSSKFRILFRLLVEFWMSFRIAYLFPL